jgi:hypothetical protein
MSLIATYYQESPQAEALPANRPQQFDSAQTAQCPAPAVGVRLLNFLQHPAMRI